MQSDTASLLFQISPSLGWDQTLFWVIKPNLYQQVKCCISVIFPVTLWNELAEFFAEFLHVRSCFRKFKRLGRGEVKSYISHIICLIKLLSWILPGFRSIFITDICYFLIPIYWKEYYYQHIYIYTLKYPLSVETSSILSLLIYYAESCQTQKTLMGAGGQEDSRIPGLFLFFLKDCMPEIFPKSKGLNTKS